MPRTGSGWTIGALGLGLALILIGAAVTRRRRLRGVK